MNEKIGIGLDLGGTSIKYALGTLNGKIIKQAHLKIDSRAAKAKIIDKMHQCIIKMLKYADQNDLNVSAIGIGTPGNVNVKTGYLMGSTPNFTHWRDINITREINKKIAIPVFVDNDANVMALGEARYGAGKQYKNIVCVTVGTGIGSGFIIDGELYRGAFYAGAEFGHSLVVADGHKCNCGSDGCLEVYASATAMINNYLNLCREQNKKPAGDKINAAYLFNLYHQGDRIARQAIDRASYYLGRGLASAINIFNPEIVIIGGGVAEAGEIFIGKVRETALRYAMTKPKENVKVVMARLGNNAGFLGAISYAFENL